MNTYEYKIASHFISAIEYGDLSALNEKEIWELENFLEDLPEKEKHGHFTYAEETYFGRCEICGMLADVCDAEYIVL